MAAAGLDFGTSNSAIGVALDGRARLAPLEGASAMMPSTVFFDFSAPNLVTYGREAVHSYAAGGEGRLMRGLKTILGSSLMDDRTQMGARRLPLRDVVGMFIRHLKRKAEECAGRAIDHVVHGRPVRFTDADEAADRRAEETLRALAVQAGFGEVSFTYEPLAAAYQYELGANAEELVLVADIGGGTSDFTIIRIGPERRARPDRRQDILANSGVRVGGTDFDRNLSLDAVMPAFGMGTNLLVKNLPVPMGPYLDLSFWPTINLTYTPRVVREIRETLDEAEEPEKLRRLLTIVERHLGHSLAFAVEDAKIALSAEDEIAIALEFIEPGLGVHAARAGFDAIVAAEMARLKVAIWSCLAQAGIEASAIDTVFLTGGSSLVPIVAHTILSELPEAKVRRGDDFLSVALGLTLEAQRRYA